MPYNSKQDAVSALLPGYRVVGEKPNVVKTANPNAGRPGEPATIDEPQGIILSVQGPGGEPDEIVVKEVGNNPNTKGGVGYDVVTGPTKAPAKTSTPAAGLERLDKDFNVVTDPSKPAAYVRDPKAPPGTQPIKIEAGGELSDPSKWTPIHENPQDPASRVIGLYDPQSQKVAASVSAPPGGKPSDPNNWKPVYRTPGDPTSGVVGQWDPTNSELHAVSALPDGKQIVTTDSAIYVVDKDTGKSSLVTNINKNSPFQAVIVDGKPYKFDPNAGTFTPGPTNTHPDLKDAAGNPMVWQGTDEDGSYGYPPGVSPAATVGNSTTLKELVWYDNQGKEVARHDNPNYQGPAQTTQGAQSTAARQIQQWNAKTGQWEWVENKGRVVASDALRQMASQLTGQVVAGDISEDEATKMLTAANAKIANDIAQQNVEVAKQGERRAAAGDILTAATQGATTGAGLLNQRVQSATGALQNIIGSAAGSKMTSVPAGVGEGLVSGLQSWVTDLGGGQAVYDTAARLVQAADPKISGDPTLAQQAQQTLAAMMTQYQKETGQPHPAVAATQAAQASQNGGMAAPQTTPGGTQTNAYAPNPMATAANQVNAQGFNPQASTAAMNARGIQDTPAGRAAMAAAAPVPVIQPATMASGFTAPPMQVAGQNYGANIAYTGGVPPWLAQPQPLPLIGAR